MSGLSMRTDRATARAATIGIEPFPYATLACRYTCPAGTSHTGR